jgi:hypothetical protein
MDVISLAIAQEIRNKRWPDNEPQSRPWRLDESRLRIHFANDHDLKAMARDQAEEIIINDDQDYHNVATRRGQCSSR